MKINLIIPMAGYGSRFVDAGYKTYKPFLKLHNEKNMISNICDQFPNNINKYFIVNNLIKKNYLSKLKKINNSKIIKIKHHKLGPLETIIRAEPTLNKLENIFISYCDITWKWDFKKVNLNQNQVFCFKGWHPFTKDNNNYAFCKILKNNNLIKIKEKSSFTKAWQNEPLSIGLFFFLNAKIMFKSLKHIKDNKLKINSEYFPSLAYNYIKNTQVRYVKQFVHIGNPRYFEEYKNWQFFFKNQKSFKKKIRKLDLSDEILLPAAGDAKRFKKENIHQPKYLIKLNNKKNVIEYINDFLPNKKKLIILKKNNKFSKLLKKTDFNTFVLNKKTNGQATTVYKVLSKLDEDSSIYINSCDVLSIFNIDQFQKIKKNADIVIFVSGKSFQDLPDKQYSWVKHDKNRFINLYVKSKPKGNPKILTGNFYFLNKKIFSNCYEKILSKVKNGEFYIDNLVKVALNLNYKVKVIEDDHYVNLGTPSLIKDFNFWESYFN